MALTDESDRDRLQGLVRGGNIFRGIAAFLEQDIDLLEEASAALRAGVVAARAKLNTLAADITAVTRELQLAQHRYQSSVSTLEWQLAQLRVFAKKRARELLALDLINEASL